ncbi:MAG TPA: indole-3-glycerol-phosphate synthase [Steroidobacteraceae bacterium]|nr:indole-3-glycerol-phosphate synthase [Steroidobacteraceae bacterium]HRX88049.1 indole-3-glycerol-phosphate synthase [Steroidobacteraceae bacterium]
MSSDFLQSMADSSRQRVAVAKAMLGTNELLARIRELPPPPPLRRSGRFDLICEVKLRSPAVGDLQSAHATSATDRVLAYGRAGAAAVSVLTEPSRFDGSMAHLEAAVQALVSLSVPAMRKDFLVDSYQVLEARAAGAGGVLVILRMLPRPQLEQLVDTALAHRLFVLLEAFDEADIALAQSLVAARLEQRNLLLVGVNCRDLVTLQVVPGRLEMLAPALPRDVARVAESGVTTPADAARVAAAGYDLALVGSALMQHADPSVLIATMLKAGRV